MDDKDMQAMKEEMAQLSTSVANISGCLDNFDTTLNNHMTDYKRLQEAMVAEQTKVREALTAEQTKMRDAIAALGLVVAKIQGSEGMAIVLIKWVVVPLIAVLAGLIGLKLMLPGGTI